MYIRNWTETVYTYLRIFFHLLDNAVSYDCRLCCSVSFLIMVLFNPKGARRKHRHACLPFKGENINKSKRIIKTYVCKKNHSRKRESGMKESSSFFLSSLPLSFSSHSLPPLSLPFSPKFSRLPTTVVSFVAGNSQDFHRSTRSEEGSRRLYVSVPGFVCVCVCPL